MLILLAIGCSGQHSTVPAWALQHASVRAEDGLLSGYQIWEFFDGDFETSRSSANHVCSLVQSLDGTATSALDCGDCLATYALTFQLIETDCPEDVASDPALRGATHFAFGAIPSEIASDAPFAEESLGWSISWDGLTLQSQGYAWDEALEFSEPSVIGWQEGAQYTLWPAYAWEL